MPSVVVCWAATLDGIAETTRVHAAAVATDDLHVGMLGQPRGDRVGVAVGQEVNHLMPLQVK